MTPAWPPLALWGGPECTVNRIHDTYRDQLIETGHHDRLKDLSHFAELGITALRYPILWERVSGEAAGVFDWSWSDSRLAEICRLGMRPIAGLLHHGSGPRYTDLCADNFVTLFTAYAEAVAERYPWILDWTPINEPLTTARFSALYGVWYPHARDERMFWRAFLNQIDGIRHAMQAIRQIIPGARLIQTEDLGETLSAPGLADEARFRNDRRWLTWDLLAGKVTEVHPLWERIASFGFAARLDVLAQAPCPPDVIGINHYLTSNRFLDGSRKYHDTPEGYEDVEAVRHSPQNPALRTLLRDAWHRYKVPLAVTESHNGCTRDEQMRWFNEAWETGLQLRTEGIEISAVTAWSLVGSCDWNSLLTRKARHYEVGVFDARGGTARGTAMCQLLQTLQTGTSARCEPRRTILATPGWWTRPVRLASPHGDIVREAAGTVHGAPILIVGGTGRLGGAFSGACQLRGLPWRATERQELDLTRPSNIGSLLDAIRPWAVINAAGWSQIDAAEDAPERCFEVNSTGAEAIAQACASRDIPCVSFSSDQVFDGLGSRSLCESDSPDPLSIYGTSKVRAEQGVKRAGGRQLVVRSAAYFSPYEPDNFAMEVARKLSSGQSIKAAADCVITATYVPDLANSVLDLLIDGESGVWHLTSGTPLSWSDFAYKVADGLGLDRALVVPVSREDMHWRGKRPAYSPLGSNRAVIMPTLPDALLRFSEVYHKARAVMPEGFRT